MLFRSSWKNIVKYCTKDGNYSTFNVEVQAILKSLKKNQVKSKTFRINSQSFFLTFPQADTATTTSTTLTTLNNTIKLKTSIIFHYHKLNITNKTNIITQTKFNSFLTNLSTHIKINLYNIITPTQFLTQIHKIQ